MVLCDVAMMTLVPAFIFASGKSIVDSEMPALGRSTR